MINVILADHEKVFRIGMASALATEEDIRIVGQPLNHYQVINGIEKFRPNVLILSSTFLSGLDEIRRACERRETSILLLQDYGSNAPPDLWEDFHGVILRSADQKTLVECVRHLARGGRVVRLTPDSPSEPPPDTIGLRVKERLTQHELGIVSHVVRGFKNREIALRLGTTEQAVKNSLRRIFDKTGVFGRLELALFVIHHRTLAAASSVGQKDSRAPTMADLQRFWSANRGITVQ